MDKKIAHQLLVEEIQILDSASQVLQDSLVRVLEVLKSKNIDLSVSEKESCEALTARFSRLCDYLFQRAFRTVDRIELQDEGTALDRLNRMEKRGVISSAQIWQELRELRNDIAHEYLIEGSDRVLVEACKGAEELKLTVQRFKDYVKQKKYV